MQKARNDVVKMFDIMQQELIIDKEERNGYIGVLLGEFTHSNKDTKKLDKLSKTLTLVFDKDIKLFHNEKSFGVTLDINVRKDFTIKILAIGDYLGEDGDRYIESFIDESVTQDEVIKILTRLLYLMPNIEIQGAFSGITDIPLSVNFLEKYIENGIRYVNKEPFYRRLKMLKS